MAPRLLKKLEVIIIHLLAVPFAVEIWSYATANPSTNRHVPYLSYAYFALI